MNKNTVKKENRIYGFKTNYHILDIFLSNIGAIKNDKKTHLVSEAFKERIMLAVTQVNGCRMCSYFHSKEALKKGMSAQQIQSLLAGDIKNVPEDEAPALIFAQHYAETIGQYDRDAWNQIVRTYGSDKAQTILAYIRVIMVGNAQGNILGALKSRIKGQPEPNSSFFMEISVILLDIFVLPFLMIKVFILLLIKKSLNKKML